MSPNSILVPKWLSGVVARLEKTEDGGARIVSWDGAEGRWSPEPKGSSIDVYAVLTAPPASAERLAKLGV